MPSCSAKQLSAMSSVSRRSISSACLAVAKLKPVPAARSASVKAPKSRLKSLPARRPRGTSSPGAPCRRRCRPGGPRRAQEGHAALGEVEDGAAEMVGRERAAGAAFGLVRAEHEVVDDELGPSVEELGERPAPVLGVEAVLLLHRYPRQLAAQARELVAAARELLLLLEQATRAASHSSRVPTRCAVPGTGPPRDRRRSRPTDCPGSRDSSRAGLVADHDEVARRLVLV